MNYLILAILSSSLFPLSLRIGEKFNFHSKTTIIFNYFFGSIFSIVLYYFTENNNLIVTSELIYSLLLGIPAGIIYYIGLVLYQQSISKYGLSLAALFMKIAMIIPIVLSILIFFERPSVYQYIGITLAIIAIIILNGGIRQLKGLTPTLLILFFVSGIGDFLSKIFEQTSDSSYLYFFTFATFIVGGISGLLFDHKVIIKNLNKTNALFGFISGFFNLFSTYFIVRTFTVMDASIAIVAINISIILIVSFVGILFFKEKLKRNEIIAYFISLISILLISL